MKRRIFVLAMAMIAATLSGCGSTNGQGETPETPEEPFVRGEEIAYTAPQNVERYENHIEIDGQWTAQNSKGQRGEPGIGDPFVMRFNGKYYLYPSTSGPYDGIKVFESDDLIHWTDKGFAVSEDVKSVNTAYAPEVVYYKGAFYLCESRSGNGHFIFRSSSPTGPFVQVSKTTGLSPDDVYSYGNLGMGIDGSFFVSDDGRLYLLHTSVPAGLKFNEFTDVTNICTETVGATGVLGEANLRHWIEGPGIFRRGDFTYLTYTGNHVNARGYRVAYSYAENFTDLSSFVQPTENVTIIDTADEHYGFGHSSNAVGPDLDSVYTAYHSKSTQFAGRRYNVDRYLASGSVLTANGPTHRPVAVPQKPAAGGYADALREEGGAHIIGTSEDFFTAEYNYTPTAGQEVYFGKKGNSAYVIKTENGKVSLLYREGTNETLLGEKETEIPQGSIAVIRVENGDGVGHVYFDNMRVITYEAKEAAGDIGYKSESGVGYTAFSNEVFGTSDFEALKNFPTKFPAVSYLKTENRGYSIAKAKRVKGGVRVGEKEATVRVGDANAVALGEEDWVKYAIDVAADGKYGLAAEVSKASSGATVEVTIGEKKIVTTLPDLTKAESDTVRVYLGELEAKAGIGTMKVKVLSGTAEFVLFEAVERGNAADASLLSYKTLRGNVRTENNVLVAEGGSEEAVMVWNNTEITDFEATLSFSCEGNGVANNLGFMVRSAHYSYHKDQPVQSFRGYYLQPGGSLFTVNRYDYGDCGTLGAVRMGTVNVTGGKRHTLTVSARGYNIEIALDDTVKLTVSDDCAFYIGSLGLFVRSGAIRVYSLSYRALGQS